MFDMNEMTARLELARKETAAVSAAGRWAQDDDTFRFLRAPLENLQDIFETLQGEVRRLGSKPRDTRTERRAYSAEYWVRDRVQKTLAYTHAALDRNYAAFHRPCARNEGEQEVHPDPAVVRAALKRSAELAAEACAIFADTGDAMPPYPASVQLSR